MVQFFPPRLNTEVAGQRDQQLARESIGTLIGFDARGMCSGG